MSDGGVKIIQAALDEWKSMSKDERRLAIRKAIAKTTEIQRVRKERCATDDHPPRYDDVFFDAVRALWRDPLDDSEGRAMTDKDWTDLGRRAVACRGWRWMPGMLVYRPGGIWEWRCVSVAKWADSLGIRSSISSDAIPDLSDPATVGCLLALVREAKDDQGWQVLCLDDGVWWIESGDHPTEAAALVAALEASP